MGLRYSSTFYAINSLKLAKFGIFDMLIYLCQTAFILLHIMYLLNKVISIINRLP